MKQETLEQAAHRILTEYGIKSIGQSIGVIKVQELMVEMAKYQAERMYSEEDLREAFRQSRQVFIYQKDMPPLFENFEEWFEQFKKK
jgi:hypothetical protein